MWRPRAPRRRSSFAQIRFLVQSLVIAAGIHSRFNKRLEVLRDLVSGAPGHAISVAIVRGEIDHRTVRLRGILVDGAIERAFQRKFESIEALRCAECGAAGENDGLIGSVTPPEPAGNPGEPGRCVDSV